MSEFRVKLTTKDGCLVQNRHSDIFVYKNRYGWDRKFIDHMLKIDCTEKGVKLISYSLSDNGIDGIVDWL